jgi:SWI/SNF-related matrix-associated actin-dependent regulator 1 of chromatin subfamily A
MPIHRPELVKLAWQHASGDVKKATVLLSDPTWDPRPIVTHSAVETTGRVTELEEASKAHRAAVKEKGKRSMIYANRSTLETKPTTRVLTPPPTKVLIDPTLSSPNTPVVAPPHRKRNKKLILDSESEVELTDSDDDRHSGTKPGQQDTSDGSRVLDYFNATGSAALQELTGEYFITDLDVPFVTFRHPLPQAALPSKPAPS